MQQKGVPLKKFNLKNNAKAGPEACLGDVQLR